MRESYTENLASYAGPESYADGGDTVGVATAGGPKRLLATHQQYFAGNILRRNGNFV